MGFNSPSLNPENVLPQWQQKIAIAENKYSSISITFVSGWIFCTKCNFLQVLDLLIFRQKQPGHWGRGCLPFSPSFYPTVRKTRCKDNDFFAIIGKEKDKNALFEGIN